MKELAPNVIMIPPKEETPQDQEHKRSLRVAAYCRVSTDNDEQLSSYENQRAYYTDKIMRESDWTMVDVFADEGKTGTSTCARKDFLRMIRQCRQGKIDMILTKSVSRFARNTVDTLKYTRELRNLGIPVIFEEQNINSIHPESEFLTQQPPLLRRVRNCLPPMCMDAKGIQEGSVAVYQPVDLRNKVL